MIISTERRFVFLGTPKCASSAIERSIRDVGDLAATRDPYLKHTPYRDFERFLVPYLGERLGLDRDDLTVFGIVREPLEWLQSWYRYRSRSQLADPEHPRHDYYTGLMDFDEFAAGWLSDSRPAYARVGSQAAFLAAGDGSVGPDELYRYDDLPAALTRISELAGRRVKLKKLNVSPRRTVEMSADTEAALREALRPDYQIFEGIAAP